MKPIDEDELFEQYKSQYEFENERKYQSDSRLQMLLTAFIAEFWLLGYMFKSANSVGFSLMLFYILIGVSVILTLVALNYFMISLYDNEYNLIPTPKIIEAHRFELQKYYSDEATPSICVGDNFKKMMFQYYVDSASVNGSNNDQRSRSIYYATYCLVFGVVLTFITYLIS